MPPVKNTPLGLLYQDAVLPTRPTPGTPSNGFYAANTEYPTFRWSPSLNATSYEWRLLQSDLTTVELSAVGITTLNYTPASTPANATYYWQVRGVNGVGYSAWSVPYRIVYADPLWTRMAAASSLVAYWRGNDASGILDTVVNPAVAEGRNIVLNPGFDSDTIWTKATGATITGGKLVYSSVANGQSTSQSIAGLIAGRLYRVTYTIGNFSAGGIVVRTSGGTGTTNSANGTFSEVILSTGTGILVIAIGTTTCDIDDISVTEVGIRPSSAFPQGDGIMPPEQVKNGGFDWDVGWTKQTGATISGGVGVATAIAPGDAFTQPTPLIIGRDYDVSYDVTITAGQMRVRVGTSGAGLGINRSTSGHYTETLTCTGTTGFGIQAQVSAWTGTIDNVSVVPHDGAVVWDGGLETWASATNLTDWTENIAGTSTVNRDTDVRPGSSGTYSVRLDIDSSNSIAQIIQSCLKTGSTYHLRFWAKASTSGKSIGSDSGIFSVQGVTTSWAQYDVVGVATTTSLILKRNTGTSASLWIDDVEIEEIAPMTGVYTNGPTLDQSTGNSLADNVVLYDGVNDLTNIWSGILNSAMNFNEFTVAAYFKFAGGINSEIVSLVSDANNLIRIGVDSSGRLRALVIMGGTASTVTGSAPGMRIHHVLLSVSKGSDEMKLYLDGVQVSSTQTGLGTWVGNLSSSGTIIGAGNTSAATPWNGHIGHVFIGNAALSASEALAEAQLIGVLP